MTDAHKTLYVASSDSPLGRGKSRVALKAAPTSDISRFRGVLAAAILGAGATLSAALLIPPPGGFVSPGPLSRPHARAKLECASCHGAGKDTASSLVPNAACEKCHGAHPSTRRGHARALSAGVLRCASCHAIHQSDQGVSFAPGQEPLRFAPGVEAPLERVAFQAIRPTTVAIPTAASCARCHDLGSTRDPIARCLLGGQEDLGPSRPIVCFDEHQVALPADGIRPDKERQARPGRGVCAGQHESDRALAWEAAREAAALVPVLAAPKSTGNAWLWTGIGFGVAALAFTLVRGASALARRRQKKAEAEKAIPEAAQKPSMRVRLPQINTNTCLGCYACVDACPYGVLEVERYVAVVARPEACCGLTLCEQRCPNGSLQVTDGDPIGDRPRLLDSLESPDVAGLYLAGDVTGLPLIKNAILQGARAAEAVAESLKSEREREASILDLMIVGAGPAGISAALKAKELGLSFEVIEQGKVAESIQSFPRGKLVFDQPLELPISGKLWLKESTKEELLMRWMRVVRKERLPIVEQTRMTRLSKDSKGFVVESESREGGEGSVRRARRVVLAIGQRGTPRRLPIELAPEVESRVHYHLADARSFEEQRVVVVGLGDVAMEAAIALSRQPSTKVVIVHRGDGFSRGSSRNIAETKRLVEAGRIRAYFGSKVVAIHDKQVVLESPRGAVELRYDAVLVMIGNIPPWDVLGKAGLRPVSEG